ncbi:MAG: hypothetical protein U0324_42030 [Polyangiales bacterium]
MELLFVLAIIAVVGVLGPLIAWASDENAGRFRWVRVLRSTESFDLGAGAFRGTRVDVTSERTTRDRAPLWVRLVAFTCYLPLGAALIAGLPWLLGVMFLFDSPGHHWDFEQSVNAVLVPAYPLGCWAAARMHRVGLTLLAGDLRPFREALSAATMVVVPLNVAILAAALWLAARFPYGAAGMLMVTPMLTLTQFALVVAAGRRHLGDDVEAPGDDALSEEPVRPS